MNVRHQPLAGLLLTLSVSACLAEQPGRGPASTAAQGLFDDGKALAAQGRYAEACPKLEESQRLDPGVGTLYRLGDCFEHTGRTASAWSSYLDAASLAKTKGQREREYAARRAAQDLEPKLSHVRLVVAAPNADTTIDIDGLSIGRADWATPVPLDPGPHTLVARAPNKRTHEASIDVPAGAATRVVEVPALENDPLPPAPARPTEARGLRGQQIAGLGLAGAGVAGLGIGAAFAVSASRKKSASMAYCPEPNRCYAPGVALRNEALASARLATVFVGVGATCLTAGALFWFLAPSSRVEVGATSKLLLVRGAW